MEAGNANSSNWAGFGQERLSGSRHQRFGTSRSQTKAHALGVLPFFAGLAPALVGIEACHTAHYWGREIAAFGHDVRLMPPQFVKPYVKSQKNDAADAEAPKPCKDSRCGLCQSNLRIAASDARLTNSPAEQPYQRHSRPFVNAGEILRRLAGVKVQHGRKQEGPPIWGAFLLFAF